METLLLASASPRRRELLESIGVSFETFAPDLDESIRDGLPPAQRVLALAEDKARKAASLALPSFPRLILSADTLVCLPGANGEELALGKPVDIGDARRMMRSISGKIHFVRTGLFLLDRVSGKAYSARSDSAVEFASMDAVEVEAYLTSGEWEGVAGAYRIQGRAAMHIVRIEGSWSGVVGLPLRELYVILAQAGYRGPATGEPLMGNR
jgi:septum formation protein